MRLVLLVVAAFGLLSCSQTSEGPYEHSAGHIEGRIRFYSARVERHPRLYPVYVQLANAYVHKAVLTSDPIWLAKARHALDRSLAIVETHEALVTLARIANYAHRYEDALRWARRALPAPRSGDPPDSAVVALLVEAHSALGQDAEARALLPGERSPPDFFTATALGGWLASQRRFREAGLAYAAAADFAHDNPPADAWARAMAAGVLMDGGLVELARIQLDAGRSASPRIPLLRLREAEYLEKQRDYASALTAYRALLRETPADPELHARAYKCAVALGERTEAHRHFDEAVRGYQQALDAGEIYTLGALAQLYSNAGVKLDDAAALAERNLQYRRDREAHDIVARVHAARVALIPASSR